MAQTVKIISDSTCDLSKELVEKYDITILPLHILLGEDEYRKKFSGGPMKTRTRPRPLLLL